MTKITKLVTSNELIEKETEDYTDNMMKYVNQLADLINAYSSKLHPNDIEAPLGQALFTFRMAMIMGEEE